LFCPLPRCGKRRGSCFARSRKPRKLLKSRFGRLLRRLDPPHISDARLHRRCRP
jgi:hypothetical protein